MILQLHISPCPNDTFIFYGLLHSKIDTFGYVFEPHFADIEQLNKRLILGDGDVIKASMSLYSRAVQGGYRLLDSGAALGSGNGPVVVRGGASNQRVALPGENTTAALLFNRYFSGYSPVYAPFNRIAEMVVCGEVELGVLIHEGRFTYMHLGLELVADLGELWHTQTDMPLPLGGIFARTHFDVCAISSIICNSTRWALDNRDETLSFIRHYASELSDEVIFNHIDCFVGEYTLSLGGRGLSAIEELCL